MKSGLVLGVDGGGSKTHLALASVDGRVRAFVHGPASGLEGMPESRAGELFGGLLGLACRQAGAKPRDIRASCFGLNGVDIRKDEGYFRSMFIRRLGLCGPVKVHNDAFIALFNDRWRDSGSVVTVGSWHKWMAVNGTREFMHDGLVFDGPKGMALERLVMVGEGFIPASPFTDRLLAHLGFPSYREFLRRWRYGGSRPAYIRPLSAVQQARIDGVKVWLGREAGRGCRGARSLLAGYAGMLAEGTLAAAGRTGLTRVSHDVVMSGSVLAGIPFLRLAFAARLKRLLPRARAVRALFRPVRGALVYAGHLAWGGLPQGTLMEGDLRYPNPSTK